MTNITQLIQRRGKAVGNMQEWRSLLDKTYRHAAPNRNAWRDTGAQGSKPTTQGTNLTSEIYDLTLLIGTRTFVNRLVNALIPQTEQWLRFIPGSQIDEKDKEEVAEALQDLTNRFFGFIDNSSFYLAMPEAFEDMAISTGVIQINEGDDDEPLVFASVPSNAISFEIGIDGSFKGYFRDFEGITPEEVKTSWPDAVVPEQYVNAHPNKKKMHVVETTVFNYETKLWDQVIFELNSSELMLEGVSEEAPAFTAFRWNRRSGEGPGRGPAMDAMPASASINEAMKDELIAAAFKANPMYMAYADTVVNLDTFRIQPGAILPVVPTTSGTWPMAPVPQAGDINFGILVVQDLRSQIEKLMLSSPLGPVDLPKQTATEATMRMQELNENAAASFSRIKRELFDPIVKRIIFILTKRGEWPDIEINGKKIAIRYETPLTATRGQREVEKLVIFHQTLTGMVGPELAAAVLNTLQLPFFLADNLEVDLDMVKNSKELKKMMDDAAKAAKQQQGNPEEGSEEQQQIEEQAA